MFAPVDSIIIPENRQRREFDIDALEELRVSIQETVYGLQHPIVVRQQDGRMLLVAGERRLRVIKDIYELGGVFRHAGAAVPSGSVPVVDLGELGPLDAFAAELEENIRRRDLTIVEAATATAQLYDLRVQQAAADGQPTVTPTDIAREIFDIPKTVPGGSARLASPRDAVKSQLIVARHAQDADVKKATSLKEAVKIIKKKEEARASSALAAAVGPSFSLSDCRVLNEDSLVWMESAAPELFDVILTDPPYGMNADEFSDSGKPSDMGAHRYDDSYENWQRIMSVFCPASFKIAAASACAYVFCDIDRFSELRDRMSKAGWTVHRTPIVWYNPDGYRCPWPDRGPQRKYELILYAVKGDRKVNRISGDVIECRKDTQVGHPAQKPVTLLKELLQRSATPISKVFDPFAGSGATVQAAAEMKLSCTGIELDPQHYGTALKRLKAMISFEEGLF